MKILASDFDETIFFLDDEEKNKRNIEAIQKFISQGNIFCIITGRNYSDLKYYLTKYHIPYTYLICEDGAKIFNNVDYCIETVLLNPNDIKNIIQVLEENKSDYYLDDGYNKTNNYNDCVKIVINSKDETEKNRIVDLLKDKGYYHIYASRFHVNIINKSVNKEKAIKKLFNIENLDYNLLHVIGDNENDYEMLKSFHGVVMKQHHKRLDELKKEEVSSLEEYIYQIINIK